jgi:hypothetical protein
MEIQTKTFEARYAYYRRCQEFCKSGEQCKAPAEKGELICHAHASQRAMSARRDAERRAVLERAAAEMRSRSRRQWTVAEMLMSFDGIQTTITVAAQALIDGTLSCKTAGRLLWELQWIAKLLRKANAISPQIFADERRSQASLAANERENARILELVIHDRSRPHGFREWLKAA